MTADKLAFSPLLCINHPTRLTHFQTCLPLSATHKFCNDVGSQFFFINLRFFSSIQPTYLDFWKLMESSVSNVEDKIEQNSNNNKLDLSAWAAQAVRTTRSLLLYLRRCLAWSVDNSRKRWQNKWLNTFFPLSFFRFLIFTHIMRYVGCDKSEGFSETQLVYTTASLPTKSFN